MHILILASWYPSEANPVAGVFFREQARALRDHGHRVGVMVAPALTSKRGLLQARRPADMGAHITAEDDDGIPTYRASQIGWFPGFTPGYNQRLRARVGSHLFERYCADNGAPDLIHAHSIIYGGYIAAQIGQRTRIPVAVTEHSSAFLRDLIQPYQTAIVTETLQCVDKCLAVSQALADALHAYAPDTPIEVLGNMVDTDFFTPPAEQPPASPLAFCTVAGLSANKGIEQMLEAFARAFGPECVALTKNKPEVPNSSGQCDGLPRSDGKMLDEKQKPGFLEKPGFSAVLHIGGDGPERAALESQVRALGVADQVIFHGRLSRDQVRDLIRRSHVMVSSSYVETFGLTLAEAMACGKPVIATRSGGPESFVDERNGLLVPTGDVVALADALRQMAVTLDRYDSDAIRAAIVARFSPEVIVTRLNAIYRELTQGATRS